MSGQEYDDDGKEEDDAEAEQVHQQVRCHTRNRSEAPLLEGDFTDEEEEEKQGTEVFVCFDLDEFGSIILIQVRLQMGEERGLEDEVNNQINFEDTNKCLTSFI